MQRIIPQCWKDHDLSTGLTIVLALTGYISTTVGMAAKALDYNDNDDRCVLLDVQSFLLT